MPLSDERQYLYGYVQTVSFYSFIMEIRAKTLDNGHLFVNVDFVSLLEANGLLRAQDIWKLKDEGVKEVVKERRTGRIFLSSPNGPKTIETYLKRYTRPPLSEKIKDILSLKFFKFDALHEWHAQLAFHRIELPTVIPIAAGKVEGGTFNMTLGITNYKRASEVLKKKEGYGQAERDKLIKRIGLYVGKMHSAGIAHQDLYLVHFFLKGPDMVPHLIDLQRVIKEKKLSDRWRIKDLGELLFSAKPFVTDTEIDTFCKAYSQAADFDLKRHPRLVKAICKKANRIEARHRRKTAQDSY